jgi:hypothetical protein
MTRRGFNDSAAGQTLISSSNVPVTDPKEKADLLMESILGGRNIHQISNQELKTSIMNAIQSTDSTQLNSPITPTEVSSALKNLKSKAIGPDLIHNQMLANLSPDNREHMRHLFNILLLNGFAPQDWREAIIVPILKPSKQPTDPLSYRPISLTSCLSKIMERVINTRLNWHLETRNLLQPNQSGFRPNRSTIDHIIALENDVSTGFASKLPTYAIFLDIAKAFDHTSTDGVLYKLGKLGVKGNLLHWIKSFLSNRTAKVRVGNQLSEPRTLSKGVPQGAVLSPALFNVMMSDLPKPPPGVKTKTFADDVAVYTTAKNADKAEQILQPYLNRLYKWGKKWGLEFQAEKSTLLTFSRSRKIPKTRSYSSMAGAFPRR